MRHISGSVLRRVLGVAVLLGAVFAIVSGPQRARACSCIGWTEAEAFANVGVVFRGRLESNDVTEADSPATSGVVALVFAVQRVFKGEAFAQQAVLTPGDPSSCGFLGRVDLDYLVFAARGETGLIEIGESDLSTNLCAGTRLITPGGVVPASFGPGVAPLSGADAPSPPLDDGDGWTSLAWVSGLAVVALLAAGWMIRSTRRS